MRRTWSVLAGVALAAAAVLVPSTGPAMAGAPATTRFQFAVIADEAGPPAAGTTLSYEAVLETADRSPVGGASVTLAAKRYGTSDPFVGVAQGVTGPDGGVSVAVRFTRTMAVRWTYAGDATHAMTTSGAIYQAVGPRITAHAKKAAVSRGAEVVVRGRVSPSKPGARLTLWEGDKPAFNPDLHYTRVGSGRVAADGTFRLATRFTGRGVKRIYVKIGPTSGNAEGYSGYVRITIR